MSKAYGDPFPGGGAQSDQSGRDMHASVPITGMQPTPEQPHLAHCCVCNQREIEHAEKRQARSLQSDEFRQIVASACEIAQHTVSASAAANDFLEALFLKKNAEVQRQKWQP